MDDADTGVVRVAGRGQAVRRAREEQGAIYQIYTQDFPQQPEHRKAVERALIKQGFEHYTMHHAVGCGPDQNGKREDSLIVWEWQAPTRTVSGKLKAIAACLSFDRITVSAAFRKKAALPRRYSRICS
jgi:hypothetical protein